MLAAIFGKKSDHPLADIKSVQVLLENLPKNDAHKSLLELTDWVGSVSEHAEFKLDHQLAVLRMFDDAAQPFVRKLAREYFTPFEISKFQENRLWLALDNWSLHVANAYYTVFNHYCNGEKGSSAIKAQVPLLAARMVHAMIMQLKYVCARYGPINKTLWDHLAQVYKHAEQHQYLDTPVNLYSSVAGNTSVKFEVGHLLVWFDVGLTSLSPLSIHLTERIVAQYCVAIDIYAQLDQFSRLSFDLNRPDEPTRINLGATTHPAMRFVSMPTIQARLESLIKVLNKNIIPDEINLGGNYEAALVTKAAQHLLGHLMAPPVRRNPRHSVNITLNVVIGFDKVVERTDAGLQFTEEEPLHWITLEISAGGFSVALPAEGSDGVGIGSLLGIQPEGVPHWGVAVVRRLLRDDDNHLYAGAETLTNQVASVLLNQGGTELDDGQLALWLYAKQGESSDEAQILLMKADTFSANRSLKVQLNGKNYLLIPIGLQEKGLDYDLAKFKRIEQEVGEE
jgi:hypothetical protein